IWICLFCFCSFSSLAQPYQIAAIKSRSLPVYENALQQIKSALKEVEFFVYDLEGDKAKGEKIFSEIRKQNINLILTFGTLAGGIAKEKEKNIPIVFTYVLNPVASGLVSNFEPSGRNITGVVLDIPLEEQFANFKKVVPNLKTIAVIYSPKETGLIVEEAKSAAKRMGLVLKPIAVSDPEEVPSKLELLKKVDGLWMTADSVVFTLRNTEYILLYTFKEGIPFMGASEEFVKAGALCGKSLPLEAINQQTVELIRLVLAGKNPGEIPIATPAKIDLVLNARAAEIINYQFPPAALKQAKVIFK
ncbi:MAG: ABC transporter substrate-binding protein, partial [Candidatus Margulisiibacteriota bacterium]